MAAAAAAVFSGVGFTIDNLEGTMLEWKVATDAVFDRKPATTASAGNKGYVASLRIEWKGSPYLMPQFDEACLALSKAQMSYLNWIYSEAPSDEQRAVFAAAWGQWYMLVCMDLVRCKEFFLHTHWLAVHASADRANDAANPDDAEEEDDDDGDGDAAMVKMHLQRIQVIFPLLARCMLCVAESQPLGTREAQSKRQAQQFAYCVDNTLCAAYGPIATYACSKYHHAVKALACGWPSLVYHDELQAYVEALLLRAAQLMTVGDNIAIHDVDHYRRPAPGAAAATTAEDSPMSSFALYVMNDRFIQYLAVTFADMFTDLTLYGQFEVVDMTAGATMSVEQTRAMLLERQRHARAERERAYAEEAMQRAIAGEEPLPPLVLDDDDDIDNNVERFQSTVEALCVDASREDAVRAWCRRAERDPSCNKPRQSIITGVCLWVLWPGEMEIFRIDNARRTMAPRDVLRTMRGRTINATLTSSHKPLGTLITDEMTAQEQRRQSEGAAAPWPVESPLLQLALLEYFSVACYVFANKLELADYALVYAEDIERRFQELAYSEQPMLVRLFHHFHVTYRGVLYRYDSLMRAFAAWLDLMHLVHSWKRVKGAPDVSALRQRVHAAAASREKNRERSQRRKAARHRQSQDDNSVAGSPLPQHQQQQEAEAADAASSASHMQALLRLRGDVHLNTDADMDQ